MEESMPRTQDDIDAFTAALTAAFTRGAQRAVRELHERGLPAHEWRDGALRELLPGNDPAGDTPILDTGDGQAT